MRVLITGSRDWHIQNHVYVALRDLKNQTHDEDKIVVVHGGARGADSMADECAKVLGLEVEVHVPNWRDCGNNCDLSHKRPREGGGTYCPRAGFVRNSHMVDLGADILLAFVRNNSKGATMTIKLAEQAGIPVVRYDFND